MVNVKAAPPAVAEAGLRLVTVGAGGAATCGEARGETAWGVAPPAEAVIAIAEVAIMPVEAGVSLTLAESEFRVGGIYAGLLAMAALDELASTAAAG
jgi:hypothetical protein